MCGDFGSGDDRVRAEISTMKAQEIRRGGVARFQGFRVARLRVAMLQSLMETLKRLGMD